MTSLIQDDNGRARPYNIRPGILRILMRNMYTSSWVAFREAVSNAYDQYQHKALKEKEKVIYVTLDPYRRIITCTDHATGIENLQNFQDVGNEDAEGISGKMVGDQISSYQNINPKIIGQIHVGKLTYVNASSSKQVKIYSNNGERGDILTMLEYGWGEPEHFSKQHANIALPHIGVKVEILDAKPELLKMKKAYEHLSEWFGILIARGLKIYIRDVTSTEYIGEYDSLWLQVLKPNDLKTDNEVYKDPLLRMSSGRYITCRLTPINKPSHEDNIDVYVKGVYIRSIHVDYLVKGWVNCDDLELDTSRDRFMQSEDSTYPEFITFLEKYIIKEGYEKQSRARNKIRSEKQLEALGTIALEIWSKLFPEESAPAGEDNPQGQEGNPLSTGEEGTGEIEKRDPGDTEGTATGSGGGTRTPKKTQVGKSKDKKPITPKMRWDTLPRGSMPTMFMESADQMIVNTDRDASSIIMDASPKLIFRVVIPFMVKAVVNFNTRGKGIDHETWDEMFETYINAVWMAVPE